MPFHGLFPVHIAAGKKKTMNQGFTTTGNGIIGVKSSLAGLVLTRWRISTLAYRPTRIARGIR